MANSTFGIFLTGIALLIFGGARPSSPPPLGVNLGADRSADLTGASVTVRFSYSTTGQPEDVTFALVSGPAAVGIAEPGANDVAFTFTGPGVYVLEATAGKGAATATDQITITITGAPSVTLTSIGVTPASPAMQLNDAVAMTATGFYSNGSQQNLTIALGTVWASSNPSVASVSSAGGVTAVGVGSASISATNSGMTGSTVVTVNALPPVAPAVTTGPDLVASLTLNQVQADIPFTATPSGVSLSWSLTSGPAAIPAPQILIGGVARFTFVQPGVYVIRLTATNSTGTAFDETTVTVELLQVLPFTATNLTAGGKPSQNNLQNDADTEVITIPAGALALAWLPVGNTTGGNPVLTDPNRTWEMVGFTKALRGNFLFRSMMPVDTTGPVHITVPAGLLAPDSTGVGWMINVHGGGINQSGINGAGAIGQLKARNAAEGGGLVSGYDLIFDAPLALTSGVAAGFALHRNVLPAVAGPGYTLLGAPPLTIVLTIQTESRADPADRAGMTWAAPGHYAAIAVELRR